MLTPVVLDVLAGFSEFGSGDDGGGDADGGAAATTCLSFEAHVGWLYPLACDLVCCRSKSVRLAVRAPAPRRARTLPPPRVLRTRARRP